MVKKGILSMTEKYAIQGMLSDKKTVEDISSALDRSERSVNKYVTEELDRVFSNVANAKLGRPARFTDLREDELQSTHPANEDENIHDEALTEKELTLVPVNYRKFARSKLIAAGLTESDTGRIILSAISACVKMNLTIKNENHLFAECIKRMSAGNFIQKKTQGQKKGVAIMSSAASQRMDEARKRYGSVSRSARGNVFNPTTGEML